MLNLRKLIENTLNAEIVAKKKSLMQLRLLNSSFVKEKAQLVKILTDEIVGNISDGLGIRVEVLLAHQDKIIDEIKKSLSANKGAINTFLAKKEFEHHPE